MIESNEWKFNKKELDAIHTNDFWYDITYCRRIDPRKLISDEDQVIEVERAINILMSLEIALEEHENME